MTQGNPWLKFFPTDWRADPGLRMCGMAARGLWIEMIGIMHEASPRGHLLINGRALTVDSLAVMAGCTAAECAELLAELEENGVFSRKRNGVIYSRKMERDEIKASKNRDNGRKGGNPALLASPSNPDGNPHSDKRRLNGQVKAQKPEARSHIERIPQQPSSPTSARAEPLPVVVVADQPDNPSFRERLLVAMGHDPTGMTATGKIVGSPGDMLEAGRWQRDLGFDEATILDVVKHVCATKRDGPPTSFAYFTQAMERHAAALKASPLAPVAGTPSAPAKRGWAPPKPFKPEPPRDKGKTKQGMREIAAMVDELRQKAKGVKR